MLALSMGRGLDFVDSFSYSGVDVCPHKVVLYKVLFLLWYDQMAHFLTGPLYCWFIYALSAESIFLNFWTTSIFTCVSHCFKLVLWSFSTGYQCQLKDDDFSMWSVFTYQKKKKKYVMCNHPSPGVNNSLKQLVFSLSCYWIFKPLKLFSTKSFTYFIWAFSIYFYCSASHIY